MVSGNWVLVSRKIDVSETSLSPTVAKRMVGWNGKWNPTDNVYSAKRAHAAPKLTGDFFEIQRLRVPRLLSNPNTSVGITCGIKISPLHFNWPRFVHGQLGLFTIYLQLPTGVPNNFSASLARQNLQNDSTVRK